MCIFLACIACRFRACTATGERNSLRFANSYAMLPPITVQARNRQATQARKMHVENPRQKSGTKTTEKNSCKTRCRLGAGFLMGTRDVHFSRLRCLSIPCLHCHRWKKFVAICKLLRAASTDGCEGTESTSNANEKNAHRESPSESRHQDDREEFL